MSRYQVDKVLREVAHDDAAQAAFVADPAAYVAGRELSEAERAALVACDYAALYGMGAHPFLLWAFVRAARPDGGPAAQEYAAALAPHGAPDFGT